MQYREIVINDELFINQEFDSVILSGKIGNPEFRTYTVEIPGKDGLLDLTESIDGSVHYNNRDIEFRVFIAGKRINERLDLLNNYHGRYVKFYSTYDNNYYYKGRLSVSIEERKATYAYVVLSFDCEPFKVAIDETKYIYLIEGTKTLDIKNCGRAVSAKITFLQRNDDTLLLKIVKKDDSFKIINCNEDFEFTLEEGKNTLDLQTVINKSNEYKIDTSGVAKIKLSYTEIKI